MNRTLQRMAGEMQNQFASYLPKAYQAGRLKVYRKYGVLKPWSVRDNTNISLLLNRHAEELAKSMAKAEIQLLDGYSLDHVITNFIGRVSSWSWALYPAMTLGMNSAIDSSRHEIVAQLPPGKIPHTNLLAPYSANQIGIIWHIVDLEACRVCQYLNGRWFDAREAYNLAAHVHPGCRCPKEFDVGTPDEATVGPIPGYHPGSARDIYSNLNISGLAQARVSRVRRTNTARGKI